MHHFHLYLDALGALGSHHNLFMNRALLVFGWMRGRQYRAHS